MRARIREWTRSAAMLIASACFVPHAVAQDFTGSYRSVEEPGELLELSQDEAGFVRGEFVEDGEQGSLKGSLQGRVANGVLTGSGVLPDGVGFAVRGTLIGRKLSLVATPFKPNGELANDLRETVVYERAAKADVFAGTYADERLTVLVSGRDGNYTGAMLIANQLYPFTARAVAAGGIAGTLAAGRRSFAFDAALAGDVLTLRSGGAQFQLKRRRPAAVSGNPLEGGAAVATETGGGGEAGVKPGFKLHKHAIGFALQVPETWKVTEAPGGLLLTPPDVKQEAWGPAENFVVTGAPAEGIDNPADPGIVQYVQNALAQTLGSPLRSVGKVESFQAGPHKAAAMTWKGTFQNGARFRTRAYVVMIDGHGVSLSYVGSTLALKRRDPVLREIVATFSSSQPQSQAPAQAADAPATSGGADPRVVGRWYRSVYRRSVLSGGISTSFHQTMLLAPDGKLSWVDQSVISGSQPSTQSSSGWTFSGIPESSVHRGTWSASGNTMNMKWDGGSATYDLHVQGSAGRREMLLTPRAGGDKELWTEYAN